MTMPSCANTTPALTTNPRPGTPTPEDDYSMIRTAPALLAPALVALTAITITGTALAAPQTAPADPVACETANAQVLIRAAAVVTASDALDASDATINDILIERVRTAGIKVDAAVKAIQALGEGAVIPAALVTALATAQAELQTASTALDDAAPSPALSEALVAAKAALAVAIGVQARVCAEPAPAPTTTPPPTTTPAPTATPDETTPRRRVERPARTRQFERVPTGSVATGGGPA